MEPMIGEAAHQEGGNDWVIDTSDDTFMQDVIEASQTTPVIVDFWAPWCGPCKQVMPALEKAVSETRGAVKLAKLNVDDNPMIAGQLRVQSIPAVYAFFQGRPVDAFQGAVPDSQIKSFVQQLMEKTGVTAGANPLDDAVEQAEQAMEAGDHAMAAQIFGQVVTHDNGHVGALSGLIRCYLAMDNVDYAQSLIDQLSDEVKKAPEIQSLIANMELAAQAGEGAAELAPLQAAVDANQDDHQARFDLAVAQFAAGQSEEAMGHLLTIIAKDREWNDDGARVQLLKMFEALGPADKAVLKARRKLSSLLFS